MLFRSPGPLQVRQGSACSQAMPEPKSPCNTLMVHTWCADLHRPTPVSILQYSCKVDHATQAMTTTSHSRLSCSFAPTCLMHARGTSSTVSMAPHPRSVFQLRTHSWHLIHESSCQRHVNYGRVTADRGQNARAPRTERPSIQ